MTGKRVIACTLFGIIAGILCWLGMHYVGKAPISFTPPIILGFILNPGHHTQPRGPRLHAGHLGLADALGVPRRRHRPTGLAAVVGLRARFAQRPYRFSAHGIGRGRLGPVDRAGRAGSGRQEEKLAHPFERKKTAGCEAGRRRRNVVGRYPSSFAFCAASMTRFTTSGGASS